MLLWEKILVTLSIVNFITMLIFLIADAFINDDSLKPVDTNVTYIAFITTSIFIVEFILFMLYLIVFKLILGAIWGIDIQLFSFM